MRFGVGGGLSAEILMNFATTGVWGGEGLLVGGAEEGVGEFV
jgi:hypothetical protein